VLDRSADGAERAERRVAPIDGLHCMVRSMDGLGHVPLADFLVGTLLFLLPYTREMRARTLGITCWTWTHDAGSLFEIAFSFGNVTPDLSFTTKWSNKVVTFSFSDLLRSF
jgi:hypothetical protein